MNINTRTWILGGTIIRGQYDDSGVYDYWVDGTVDSNFNKILEEIGVGKKVSVVIQTCEVK